MILPPLVFPGVVVLLVVWELKAAITGDCVFFFLKGEKLLVTILHEAETEVLIRIVCCNYSCI